jgi:2-polyprenyl-3-methyl-5-hydroxy-6-metoxy-1,4-benzoquinol methylase
MREPTAGKNQLAKEDALMRGGSRKTLGRHWPYNLLSGPKHLAFVLSRYKFAAKMIGRQKRVLELGCSEETGIPILAEFATHYTGVDLDGPAIITAKENWPNSAWQLLEADFMGQRYGTFDGIVRLDVIEHIHREYEPLFLDTIRQSLGEDGVCVIGTPNVTSAPYASPGSQRGHVNLYDAARLGVSRRGVRP